MIISIVRKLKHFIKTILRSKHARKLTQQEAELEYLKWRYFFEILTRKYMIILILLSIIWLKESAPINFKAWLDLLT
jgi:hypothetical protein